MKKNVRHLNNKKNKNSLEKKILGNKINIIEKNMIRM